MGHTSLAIGGMAWLVLFAYSVAIGVVLIMTTCLLGYVLPVQTRLSTTRFLPFPSKRVFSGIQDHSNNPVTGRSCRSQRPFGSGDAKGWVERMGSGGVVVKTLEVVRFTRILRSLNDQSSTMTSSMEYTLDDAEEGGVRGTLLSMVQVVDIPTGTWHTPVFRILVRLLGTKGMNDYISRLNAYLTRR